MVLTVHTHIQFNLCSHFNSIQCALPTPLSRSTCCVGLARARRQAHPPPPLFDGCWRERCRMRTRHLKRPRRQAQPPPGHSHHCCQEPRERRQQAHPRRQRGNVFLRKHRGRQNQNREPLRQRRHVTPLLRISRRHGQLERADSLRIPLRHSQLERALWGSRLGHRQN